MSLNPGDTLLNGQYQILGQLGQGGFGFVYEARDTLVDKTVAVKELIPALVGDQAVLKRFLAEARFTMDLTHDRIVRTHIVFSEGENYYIVMECMAGGSLEDRLRGQATLPVEEAVRLAIQVCQGLSYAHARGVVHCDLKPANILFGETGSSRSSGAKVADFGIAHVSEEMITRTWRTPAGFVAGTLPYMSPEQADGVRNDPRIDVYAVGAVLYRALTGQTYLDFDRRDTPGATADNVYRIRTEEPPPPSALNGFVPAWLDEVVLKALAKRPEDRFQRAADLGAALRGRSAKLRPARGGASPPEETRQRLAASGGVLAGRERLLAGALTAVTVLAVLACITTGLLWSQSRQLVAENESLAWQQEQLSGHNRELQARLFTAEAELTKLPRREATPEGERALVYSPTPSLTVPPAPTETHTPGPTDTAEPAPTETYTPGPTHTVEPTPTETAGPTATGTGTPTPSATFTSRPTPTASMTVTTTTGSGTDDGQVPTPEPQSLTTKAGLNVRVLPGIQAQIIETVERGTRLSILGRDPASGWFYVCCVGPDKDLEGWVLGDQDYVKLDVPLDSIPEISP